MNGTCNCTTTYLDMLETYKKEKCFICNDDKYYKDNKGVWHECPRCLKEKSQYDQFPKFCYTSAMALAHPPSMTNTYSYSDGAITK